MLRRSLPFRARHRSAASLGGLLAALPALRLRRRRRRAAAGGARPSRPGERRERAPAEARAAAAGIGHGAQPRPARPHAAASPRPPARLTLTDPQGAPQAEYGFVAYTLDGAEPGTRPVTFAVNGGPGASSAYLHLLAIGPWRLPIDGPTHQPVGAAGASCRTPRPGSTSPTSSSSTRRAPATAGSSAATRCASASTRSRATSTASPPSSTRWLQGEEPAAIAEILRRRELWRLPRPASRRKAPERPGHRPERPRAGVAGARFRLVRAAVARALGPRHAPAVDGGRRAGGRRGAGHPRGACARRSATRRASTSSTSCAACRTRRRSSA